MAITINSNSITEKSTVINIYEKESEIISGESSVKRVTDEVTLPSNVVSIDSYLFIGGSVALKDGNNIPLTENDQKVTVSSNLNANKLTTTIEYTGTENITSFTYQVRVTCIYKSTEQKPIGITFNSDGSISIDCTSLKVNGKTIS